MRHCTSCGTALLDGFRFCVQCGATVDAIEPTPAEPAAEPILEPVIIDEPAAETTAAVSGMPEYIPEPAVSDPVMEEPDLSEPVMETPAITEAAPVYAAPAPVYAAPVYTAPAAEPAAPLIDERNVLSFTGAFVSLLLLCIPGVNLLTAFIWAVGGAKNRSRRSLSRAWLLLVLAFVLFFGCMGLLIWLFAKEQILELIAVVRDAAAAYGITF